MFNYLGSTGIFIADELGTLIGADTVILGIFESLGNGMSLGSVGVNGLFELRSWHSFVTSEFVGNGIESIHC